MGISDFGCVEKTLDTCRVTVSTTRIGQISYYDCPSPNHRPRANILSRDNTTTSPQHRVGADADVACESNPRTKVDMIPQSAVMVDRTTGIQYAIVAHFST